jgi:hypothetical protein
MKYKYMYYHIVGIVPNYNRKKVEKGQIDTPNTQIHDRSLFWLATGTSIKCGVVKNIRTDSHSKQVTSGSYQKEKFEDIKGVIRSRK